MPSLRRPSLVVSVIELRRRLKAEEKALAKVDELPRPGEFVTHEHTQVAVIRFVSRWIAFFLAVMVPYQAWNWWRLATDLANGWVVVAIFVVPLMVMVFVFYTLVVLMMRMVLLEKIRALQSADRRSLDQREKDVTVREAAVEDRAAKLTVAEKQTQDARVQAERAKILHDRERAAKQTAELLEIRRDLEPPDDPPPPKPSLPSE